MQKVLHDHPLPTPSHFATAVILTVSLAPVVCRTLKILLHLVHQQARLH